MGKRQWIGRELFIGKRQWHRGTADSKKTEHGLGTVDSKEAVHKPGTVDSKETEHNLGTMDSKETKHDLGTVDSKETEQDLGTMDSKETEHGYAQWMGEEQHTDKTEHGQGIIHRQDIHQANILLVQINTNWLLLEITQMSMVSRGHHQTGFNSHKCYCQAIL